MRVVARATGAAALALLGLLAFTPLAGALAGGAARSADPRPADAIVVLGSGVMPEGELADGSLRRTVHGVRLFHRGLAPRLVLLGPRYRGVVEAEVRAAYARDLGVPPDAIVVEAGGTSTRDEAMRITSRLRPRSIVLVTGMHHMPRARRVFERAGMRVEAAPVLEESALSPRPQARLGLARALGQEMLARAYYRLAGAL